MKTENQLLEENRIKEKRERVLPQIREIEASSKIKLVDEMFRSNELKKELADTFGRMRELDVDNVIKFVYEDVRSCTEGLVVLIDGGAAVLQRLYNSKNYRSLMAKHIAFSVIVSELLSDRIVNLDNMLREVDFDLVVTSGISFDSRVLHEKLTIPHILFINDVNPSVVNGVITYAQRDKDGQYGENVSNRERLSVFLDQILGERMAAGKITIFTFLDSYQSMKKLEKQLGTRLCEYMCDLFESANCFEERALRSHRCCRISLVTNAMLTSGEKRKYETSIESIQKALTSLGVEHRDFFDLTESIKDACRSVNRDYDDVFESLAISFSNCRTEGESGKVVCEHMINLMRNSPKSIAIWEGKSKGKVGL